MRTRTTGVAVAAALLTLPLTAAPALAGPPGKWSRVTPAGTNLSSTVTPGVARTSDGVLHVSWTRQDGATAESLHHIALSPDAKTVSGQGAIFTSTEGVNHSSALVASGTALRVFFGATNERAMDPLEVYVAAGDTTAAAIRDGVRQATGAPGCPALSER